MFTPREIQEFQCGFNRIIEILAQLGSAIETPREQIFLELGLRGSHIEESLASGDYDRANAHFKKALELVERL